jgi:hypothetical protein
MGKHSGSGQDRNYDLDNANNVFKSVMGRDLRPDEIQWLQTRGDVNKVGHDQAVQQYAAGLKNFSSQIVSEAKAAGLDNFTAADADKLRDSTYTNAMDPYEHDNFMSLIRPQLERLSVKQVQQGINNPTITTDQQSTVDRLMQQTLGRAATDDEKNYFAKQLANGESPYELQQVLQQSPEYLQRQSDLQAQKQTQEAQAARQSLNDELMKNEQTAFQQAIPDILSSYMKAGRLNSSGVDNAIAAQRAKLAQQRNDYLAQVGFQQAMQQAGYNRQDFVNNQAQAYQQFQQQQAPYQQQQLGLSQLPLQQFNRQLAGADQRQQREYDLADYQRQQNDFNNYLEKSKQASQQGAMWNLGGSILGAGVTGYTYGLGRGK